MIGSPRDELRLGFSESEKSSVEGHLVLCLRFCNEPVPGIERLENNDDQGLKLSWPCYETKRTSDGIDFRGGLGKIFWPCRLKRVNWTGRCSDKRHMLRRVVTFLLLPCVLLTQSAAFGHSHGGSHAGHDLGPHVHTNPVPSNHHHDHNDGHHHHGHGGHHHAVVDEVPPDVPVALSSEPQSNHDSDAIYVSATDAVTVERAELPGGSSDFWMAFTSDLFAQPWAVSPACPVICGYPPPLRGHACPLYVKHLALLI